jgi:hypothetical protein
MNLISERMSVEQRIINKNNIISDLEQAVKDLLSMQRLKKYPPISDLKKYTHISEFILGYRQKKISTIILACSKRMLSEKYALKVLLSMKEELDGLQEICDIFNENDTSYEILYEPYEMELHISKNGFIVCAIAYYDGLEFFNATGEVISSEDILNILPFLCFHLDILK